MKFVRVLVGLAAIVTIMVPGGVSASAASSNGLTTSTTVTEVRTTRWVDADGYVRLPLAELEALARQQSRDEIETVVESGRPFNGLLDPKAGRFIAATYASKAQVVSNAITTGCGQAGHASSSRYVGGRAMSTCFNGSGSLNISLPQTFYVSAGNRWTTWWYSSTAGWTMPAGTATTIASPINVIKVSR